MRRFEQEARAASALNHPNILTICEIGQQGELHYIAAEFIDGQTLRQRLTGEALMGSAIIEKNKVQIPKLMPKVPASQSVYISFAHLLSRKKSGQQVQVACLRLMQPGQQTVNHFKLVIYGDPEPGITMFSADSPFIVRP
jgi:serine/threonine protein kinase